MLHVPIQVGRGFCFTQLLKDPGWKMYHLLVAAPFGTDGVWGGCHKFKDVGIEGIFSVSAQKWPTSLLFLFFSFWLELGLWLSQAHVCPPSYLQLRPSPPEPFVFEFSTHTTVPPWKAQMALTSQGTPETYSYGSPFTLWLESKGDWSLLGVGRVERKLGVRSHVSCLCVCHIVVPGALQEAHLKKRWSET